MSGAGSLWRSCSAELAEIGLRYQQAAYVEAAHRCVALQDRCAPADSMLDREIVLRAGGVLAQARVAVGSLADAETDLAALLNDLGPDRRPDLPRCWLTMANFAWVVMTRGRYGEGIDIAERVVRECVRRWGEDASVVRSARGCLGICLTEGGRPEGAVPILTALLEDTIDKFGPDSAPTVRISHSLAEAALKLGMLDEAENGFAVALSGDEKHGDHRSFATGARFGQAKVAALRGRVDEAADGFTRVLAELRDTAGPDGPWTLHTRFELAELDARRGNIGAALAMHRGVLADRIRVLGPDHPDTARSRVAVRERAGEGD